MFTSVAPVCFPTFFISWIPCLCFLYWIHLNFLVLNTFLDLLGFLFAILFLFLFCFSPLVFLVFFKALIDFLQFFLCIFLNFFNRFFILTLRKSIIFIQLVLRCQLCWNIQILLWDNWALLQPYFSSYYWLYSYTGLLATRFLMVIGLGSDFWLCLFLGDCFIPWFRFHFTFLVSVSCISSN